MIKMELDDLPYLLMLAALALAVSSF